MTCLAEFIFSTWSVILSWIFVGTDEYGKHAAVMVSLIASCRLHGINPERVRLFCVRERWDGLTAGAAQG